MVQYLRVWAHCSEACCFVSWTWSDSWKKGTSEQFSFKKRFSSYIMCCVTCCSIKPWLFATPVFMTIPVIIQMRKESDTRGGSWRHCHVCTYAAREETLTWTQTTCWLGFWLPPPWNNNWSCECFIKLTSSGSLSPLSCFSSLRNPVQRCCPKILIRSKVPRCRCSVFCWSGLRKIFEKKNPNMVQAVWL